MCICILITINKAVFSESLVNDQMWVVLKCPLCDGWGSWFPP